MVPRGDLIDDIGSQSYFVPMVDMLAGVVFLLIIMLASSVLVTRDDFGRAKEMQDEIDRIARSLEEARLADLSLLEPRREAAAAARLLLERIGLKLRNRGYATDISSEAGEIKIVGTRLFSDAAGSLSNEGEALTKVLGEIFEDELPCLASPRSVSASCREYGYANLDRIEVSAARKQPEKGFPTISGTLQFLADLSRSSPRTFALRSSRQLGIITEGDVLVEGDESGDSIYLRVVMHTLPVF